MTEPVSSRIGVLIVDDHRMFAESLARLLDDEDDLHVVGIAADRAEAVALAVELTPQVVLVDYQLPEINGDVVAAEIKRLIPDVVIVMLTGAGDDRVLVGAIDAGCSGFLMKQRAASEVVDAVRMAAAGEALISPRDLARLLPKLNRNYYSIGSDLTGRERQILVMIARGATNRAIAAELYLSVNTVRNYVQAILTKLGAHSKLEAVATAVRESVIEYPLEASVS
jgi:DNA-binding NarL/FixJ family response regulator